ncbi:MAG TPA: hypothetical protein VHS97_08985 [Isosphaeraceae bacterium]|nr:hypothetical protein [Isosphaeraceae bacterium]
MDKNMTAQQIATDLPQNLDYRPTSPMAVLSVVIGLLALVSACLVYDLGPTTFEIVSSIGLVVSLESLSVVRRYELRGRGAAKAGLGLSVAALVAGFGIISLQSAFEVPAGCLGISYEALQPKPGESIPASARVLDGKKVFIKGYMYPSSQMTGIREFVLCRDNGTCCFGGQPKLSDMIQVNLKEPLALDYQTGLRQLAGTFRVVPNATSVGLGSVLYRLDADYAR